MNIKKGEGVPDFVLLDTVSEGAMFENMTTRFKGDMIYTYIGDVVVSVNPYKPLNIFNRSDIENYRGRYKYERAPHIYALAGEAYRAMVQGRENQCVIISGESGAGKTEASKIVMQYVTAVCVSSKDGDGIKQALLESNPLLEAFGNAKTLRNDNSSRFGKYMEMQFSCIGAPIGGQISNYLLEKSRVVARAEGERSFHIFYQLLAGLPSAQLERLDLERSPLKYAYLAISKCVQVPSIDDAAEFKAVTRAMTVMGIPPNAQEEVFGVLAGILHLGNVAFEKVPGSKTDEVKVTNNGALERAARALKCAPEQLRKALVFRTITATGNKRQSVIPVPLDMQGASFSRDALAKALYERLFNWLVLKVNEGIKCKSPQRDDLSIGLLDIYGFEVFQKNSFEQLNINYCNEKLQQLFIELTLKSEQEEYVREGIEWEEVKYFNNKTICDLIEKKPIGIVALMDEECLMAQGSDATLLEKLNKHLGQHPHFQGKAAGGRESQGVKSKSVGFDANSFKLLHYAGEVIYDVTGMLEKNKDTLFVDVVTAMAGSASPLVQELFETAFESKKRPESAGSQFRSAMAALMQKLLACRPHYVRCIKPNDDKRSGYIDDQRVLHQIRYLGLLENVRVRRAGFAFRQTHERFLQRYKMLCRETWPEWRGPAHAGVARLMAQYDIPNGEFRIGKTKIFIRDPQTLFKFEALREAALPRLVTLMQKIWKGYKMRRWWVKMKGALMVQKHWKAYKERIRYLRRKGAFKILMTYRKYKARRWISDLRRAFSQLAVDPHRGKNVTWPIPPKALEHGASHLRQIHRLWRAERMIASLGDDTPQMHLKIATYDIFGQGRKPWNCARRFEGNYIDHPSNAVPGAREKFVKSVQLVLAKSGDTQLIYANNCVKVNRRGKSEVRSIVVTNRAVFRLAPKTFKLRKGLIPLSALTHISLSPLTDATVVLHFGEGHKDLLLNLEASGFEGASELVTLLTKQCTALGHPSPRVDFKDDITFNNGRPKTKDFHLSFASDQPGPWKVKKGKGNGYVVCFQASARDTGKAHEAGSMSIQVG